MTLLRAVALCAVLGLLLTAAESPDLLNNPMDIVFDSVHNRYLVSNYADGRIISIDADNQQRVVLQTGGHCKSLDLVGDTLYVAVDSRLCGYLLPSGDRFLDVKIETVYGTAGVAADDSGHVYVTAPEGRVFKVLVADGSHVLLADEGLKLHLHNCAFDRTRNRLIVVEHQPQAPIKAVNIDDGSVSEWIRDGVGDWEGVAVGERGDIYVASYDSDGSVYRIDAEGVEKPVLLSGGLGIPTGLTYNRREGIVALCCYEPSRVVFVTDTVRVGR
ncbi:MAG: hypothetical protein JSW34_01160 [Candidatus Zixiibacteriota bacterium]|nr:MAG: hypothetical protein JSW34_01160 [candidate division Zixibacteria bacterium]